MIKSLAKSVLIPLGLTAAASAADAGIYKEILGSGNNNNTILIISNDEIKDIVEIAELLQYSGLLPEGVSDKIQNEAKEQRGGFLSILLGTLGASLLWNIWTGKEINRAEEGVIRASYGNKKGQKTTKKRQHYEKKIVFLLLLIH